MATPGETTSSPAFSPVVLRVGLIVLFVIGQAASRPGFGLSGQGLAVTGLTLAVAATVAAGILPLPRTGTPGRTVLRAPIKIIFLCLAAVASILLIETTNASGPAVASLLFVVGAAAARHPPRHSAPVAIVALAALLLGGVVNDDVERDLGLCLSVCFAFLLMNTVALRRAARRAEAREAVLAERARIAREIHDILAHSLSAQIVHLEGARLLLRADRAHDALERVERARELAKNGLEEARRAVAALREDLPPLPVALRALADEFRTATGHECEVEVSGPERRLPSETELAVVRTAQEAITNVRSHAPGSPARVRLRFQDGACELEVANPASEVPGTPGGGYGLVGMRERAELLGGTLEAGEAGDGFLVRLRVPS
ncbi:sensor histidine kinase [Microtetraspora niveoalba]|uniref:sensor histidine kinase n=1 Tax=Microtetraspora niveoalba TaxID=46175 RepID=UPI000B07038F|nr:sensor histidine kinase [Microtetraspora niveoalba]